MPSKLHRLFPLVPLGAAAFALALLTGCSDAGSPLAAPAHAGPQAAKNLYLLNYSNSNSIEADTVLIFPATSAGNATPTSTLSLPANFNSESVAVSPTGEIYVAGFPESDSSHGVIFIYAADATGSANPTATLTGSTTGNGTTFDFATFMTFNSKGQLFVQSSDYSIVVFAAGATSASSPTQYISWGQSHFDDIWGIAADAAGEVFIADYGSTVIDVFAAGAEGNTAPVRTITGTNTGTFTEQFLLASDDAGNLSTTNFNNSSSGLPTSIITFPAGVSGNATPTRILYGPSTNISDPQSLTIDAKSNLYYVDDNLGVYTTMLFSPTATGNVAPNSSFTSTTITNSFGGTIAAY